MQWDRQVPITAILYHLIGRFALGTLTAVAIFPCVSSVKTFGRLNSRTRKSNLAANPPSTPALGQKPVGV